MTLIKKTLWRDRLLVLTLPALLVGGLMFTGCSNDAVSPQEEAPALSDEDAAHQAGLVALAATIVGPQTIEFAGKSDKDSYTHTFPFDGDVTGTVHLDYFSGGPDGIPAPWNTGDYVDLYTAENEWVTVSLGLGGTITLTFDIGADLDRPNNTATINGAGTFASGPYTAVFTFVDFVVVQGVDYPSSGTMNFVGSGFSVDVTFDGDNTALLVVNDTPYLVNLDTGVISEIVPV